MVWQTPPEDFVIKNIPASECEQFHSRLADTGWILEHNGKIIGTYLAQIASEAAARAKARRVRNEGGFACIVFHKPDGSILDTQFMVG